MSKSPKKRATPRESAITIPVNRTVSCDVGQFTFRSSLYDSVKYVCIFCIILHVRVHIPAQQKYTMDPLNVKIFHCCGSTLNEMFSRSYLFSHQYIKYTISLLCILNGNFFETTCQRIHCCLP